MTDRYENRRSYQNRGQNEYSRNWRRGGRDERCREAPKDHYRDNRREDWPSEWIQSGWSDPAPSSRNKQSNQLYAKDSKVTELDDRGCTAVTNSAIRGNDGWLWNAPGENSEDTKLKGHHGWDEVKTAGQADATSGWEILGSKETFDWSEPPHIESVDSWDDSGVKETWKLYQSGRLPVEDADLYIDKNINWHFRTCMDIPSSADDKRRLQKAFPRRSGSPVILNLESLLLEGEAKLLQGTGQVNARKSKSNLSGAKAKKDGEISGWDVVDQSTSPAWQGAQQQPCEPVLRGKRKISERDDNKDKSYRSRGGRDDWRRKPRYSSSHRYD